VRFTQVRSSAAAFESAASYRFRPDADCAIVADGEFVALQTPIGGAMPDIHAQGENGCNFAVGTVWGTLSGYALIFTLDGNLELQSPTRMRLWESGTRGSGGRILSMQHDGNLVMYDASRRHALWATRTTGNPGAFLSVQEDGNVVIYTSSGAPIWATDTASEPNAGRPPEFNVPASSTATVLQLRPTK
jgi:hypothetical protein